jgi:hypothetical protein
MLPATRSQLSLAEERSFLLPSELMKEGGMVTGGKFDHKTNPIDIVKKGQKDWRDDWRRSNSQSSATKETQQGECLLPYLVKEIQ